MRILNYYYGRWARLRLLNWQPYIIVLTGHKNQTLLHSMLTSQLGEYALDIKGDSNHSSLEALYQLLGFKTEPPLTWKNLNRFWPILTRNWRHFCVAPLQVNKKLPPQPVLLISGLNKSDESRFFAQLIEPDAVLWSGANNQNFFEISHFIAETQDVVMIDGDSAFIGKSLSKIKTNAQTVNLARRDYFLQKKTAKIKPIATYQTEPMTTTFSFRAGKVVLPGILPEKAWLAIAMTEKIMELLNQRFDRYFSNFSLPSGQGNCWQNHAHQIILDASEQSVIEAIDNFLQAFDSWGAGQKQKWLIIGGLNNKNFSETDYQKVIEKLIKTETIARIILVGAAAEQWQKAFAEAGIQRATALLSPAAACEYLQDNLYSDEAILIAGGGEKIFSRVMPS